MSTISAKGLAFVAREEGFVSRAYRDPVGVLTIGFGFTSRSGAVRRHLGTVKPGMTISRAEAERVLEAVIDEEFGPAAAKGLPGARQHEFDMGCSAAYNAGSQVFGWRWARLWRQGAKEAAAARWRTTATTAKGRRLPGLVARRRREAELLLTGDYGQAGEGHPSFPPARTVPQKAAPDATLKGYQGKLAKLGYYDGALDGLRGPKTTAAVRAFQQADGHLRVDGILGRATMASIDRRFTTADSKREATGGAVLTAIGTVLSWLTDHEGLIAYVAAGILGAVLLYFGWKYRAKLDELVRSALGGAA